MFQANTDRLKDSMRNIPRGAGIFAHPMSDDSDARVLLVQSPTDDGLDMYAEFLHYHGLVPMPVTNAHDALNVAPAAAVIVTGILLHDSMDGFQLIDRLRGDDRTKNRPIIVLTACAWPSDRARPPRRVVMCSCRSRVCLMNCCAKCAGCWRHHAAHQSACQDPGSRCQMPGT